MFMLRFFFCGSFCLSRLVLLSCFILASFFHLLLSIMCPKPVVRVRGRIVRPLHVRCRYIRFMDVNELYDLRDVIIRSLAVLDYYNESDASDLYMSYVRGLYHVDVNLIRLRRLRGALC